jgi:hypothetical protein
MTAQELSERLLAIACAFQTIELLQLRAIWSDTGVWRWETLRKEYRFPPDLIFNARGFYLLLLARLLCSLAVCAVPSGVFLGVLFFSTWAISVRWRGTFNGGSDSMTTQIALALWIARLFESTPWITHACLAYIAVQVTASYFISGCVKFKNADWRNGKELPRILRTPGYDSAPAWILRLFEKHGVALAASLSVIPFELAFPLAWTSPRICLVFIAFAIVFHLACFWLFGLNRFVFAWLAAYPALYSLTHQASKR